MTVPGTRRDWTAGRCPNNHPTDLTDLDDIVSIDFPSDHSTAAVRSVEHAARCTQALCVTKRYVFYLPKFLSFAFFFLHVSYGPVAYKRAWTRFMRSDGTAWQSTSPVRKLAACLPDLPAVRAARTHHVMLCAHRSRVCT